VRGPPDCVAAPQSCSYWLRFAQSHGSSEMPCFGTQPIFDYARGRCRRARWWIDVRPFVAADLYTKGLVKKVVLEVEDG
jgi:hypothetical protein